jgi:hypothetical protein
LSSAYSMISLSWWWKNSRIPERGRGMVSETWTLFSQVYGTCSLSSRPRPDSQRAKGQTIRPSICGPKGEFLTGAVLEKTWEGGTNYYLEQNKTHPQRMWEMEEHRSICCSRN